MDVRKVIKGCIEGGDRAWDDFMTLVHPVISGVGRKYVVQDLEDFCQNVYMQLIAREFALLKRFQSNDRLELLKYVRSIAWRIAKNQSRKNQIQAIKVSELAEADLKEAQVEDLDLKLMLSDAMMRLALEEREIMLLQAVGYKYREIAEFLGRPLNTVLSKANRAQKKLKKWLQ